MLVLASVLSQQQKSTTGQWVNHVLCKAQAHTVGQSQSHNCPVTSTCPYTHTHTHMPLIHHREGGGVGE